MTEIVWLASYPKSGNTWLRFIVFWLEHGREPHDSRELDAFTGSRLPPRYPEAPAFCRPRGEKDDRPAGTVYCKTHATADALRSLWPETKGAITIVRDAIQVLHSALNYALLNGEIVEDERERWIDAYIETGGNPLWLGEAFSAGTWKENAASWRADLPFPVLHLSYQMMLDDPRPSISAIAAFIGRDAEPETVNACADATSFERMKAFEEREVREAVRSGTSQGRFTAPHRLDRLMEGRRFFQSGGKSNILDAISPEQVTRAVLAFGG